MLHKRLRLLLLAMLLMSLALVACGGETEEPTPEPTEEPTAEPTAEPTEEPTAEPTEEPTPEPTEEPTPEPTPEPTMAMSAFSNEESGLALQYPEEWFTEEQFGLAVFATNEQFLDEGPESGDEGAVALALAIPQEAMTVTTPAELLEIAVGQFPIGEVESVGEVEEGTADSGAPTAYTLATGISDSGETELTIFYGVIIDGDYGAALIGVTPTEGSEEYIPTFQAMLASMQLSEPVLPDLGDSGEDTLIFYGDTLDGALETAESVARYNFIGFIDEVVNITVTPNEEDFDLVVDVVDADGNSILETGAVDASFGEETIEGLVIPDNGDYYIVVTGFAGSIGSFTVNIEQVETPDAGTDVGNPVVAGALTLDTPADGVVTEDENSSWVFTANEGDVVTIVVTPEEGFDAVVDVVDATGTSILPSGEVDSSFDEETISDLVIPATGEYTVVVRGFADAVGTFRVTLSSSASTGDVPADTGSSSIAYGSVVQGFVPADGTESWSFFGSAGDEILVYVTPTDESFDSVVRVIDSSGNSILELEEVDVFGSEEVTVTLSTDDEYTIEVSGFSTSSGSYELVLVEQFTVENPGSFLQTTYILDEIGESHAFPFTVSAGDVIVAVVTPTSTDEPVDVVVDIYEDLDVDALLETIDLTVGDTEEVVFTAPADGTYYFDVRAAEGSSGGYEIVLVGSPATEILLAGGDVIYGLLGEADVIRYALDGFAGDAFSISLNTSDSADGVIRLIDVEGNEIASIDSAFTGGVEYTTYTFEEETTIYIEISDFFDEIGQFILTIDALPQ